MKPASLALLALCLLLCAVPLFGGRDLDRLPDFDSRKHCQFVAHFGSYSQELDSCCLRTETGAHAYLEAAWPTVPHSIREACMQQASFAGNRSYSLLKRCVARSLELRMVEARLAR